MLTEDFKAQVKKLSSDEEKELRLYMVKLRLESDEAYQKRIRERTDSYYASDQLAVEKLKQA